jgi:hypothetical protein
MDQGPSIAFSFQEIAKSVVTGIGLLAVWILKKIGDKHIASLERLEANQERILTEVSGFHTRLSVAETKIAMIHKSCLQEESLDGL